MGKRSGRLPGHVQKLIKRLADIERDELALLHTDDPDEDDRMISLITKRKTVKETLFRTEFAREEVGVSDPYSPEDLMKMGRFLLGEYALDRLAAEEGEEPFGEEFFYAWACLKQDADTLAEAYRRRAGRNRPAEQAGNAPEDMKDSRIIPLFGKKNK